VPAARAGREDGDERHCLEEREEGDEGRKHASKTQNITSKYTNPTP